RAMASGWAAQAVPGPPRPGAPRRFDWLALGLAMATAVAPYVPILMGLAGDWAEYPSLSHGFAVPLISAYLLWNRRHQLAEAAINGSLAGLPLIVVALAMLVIGSLGGESFVA